jgi:hypothetical protein
LSINLPQGSVSRTGKHGYKKGKEDGKEILR